MCIGNGKRAVRVTLGYWRALFSGVLLLAPLSLARADAGLLDELMLALAAVPDTAGVPVYLRLDIDEHWPRVLQVRVNRQPAQRHEFTPEQAAALSQGALMHVAEVPMNAHRVEFELWLARDADPAAEAGARYHYTLLRPELHRATTIMAAFRRSLWRAWRPRLQARTRGALSAEQQESVAATDLAVGRGVAAGVRLQALKREQALSARGQLLLGDVQAELGIDPEPLWQRVAAASPPGIAAEAAIRLVERAALRGDTAAARQWLPLSAGALMDAADRFRYLALRIALDLDDASTLADGPLRQGPVALAAYNQVLVRDHATRDALLERMGHLEMADDLAWAVRDQVNLALGYAYLRRRLPERAHDAFARVRAQGALAHAGRLGLGWAQIMPGGGASYAQAAGADAALRPALRPRDEQAWAEARRTTPLRTATGVAQGHQAEQLRRALLPWTDLIGADPLDPAVQEAMLAIPYALGHLGAHEDAARRWQDAIGALTRLQQAIVRAGRTLDQDRLSDWLPGPQQALALSVGGSRWWRQAVWPDNFLVGRLRQEPAVSLRLQQCDQWQQVRAHPGADQLSSSQRMRMAHAVIDCRQALLADVRQLLKAWQSGVSAYLSEAQLAVARQHDAAPFLLGGRGRR